MLGASATKPPILLTGLPRSGSTWVMQMLSSSGEVIKFHEPDHLHLWGIGDPGMHPFIHPDSENPDYEWMYRKVFAGTSYRRFGLSGDYLQYMKKRFKIAAMRKRVLVKSVYSLHNTEWIARRFPVKVVLLLRHPCAVIHSIHRRWPDARLKDLTSQHDFMLDCLEPYRSVLTSACTPHEVLASRIGAYYLAAARAAARNPDWVIVRHEDLCADPLLEFGKLYKSLGMDRFEGAAKAIENSNRPQKSDEVSHVQRVASNEIGKWKLVLSPAELQEISDYYCPFPSHWYTDFCVEHKSSALHGGTQ